MQHSEQQTGLNRTARQQQRSGHHRRPRFLCVHMLAVEAARNTSVVFYTSGGGTRQLCMLLGLLATAICLPSAGAAAADDFRRATALPLSLKSDDSTASNKAAGNLPPLPQNPSEERGQQAKEKRDYSHSPMWRHRCGNAKAAMEKNCKDIDHSADGVLL